MEEKQIISSEELQSMLNDLQEPEKCDAFFTIYDVQALKANPNYRKELSKDRHDLLSCIKDGWYEIFDRYDSDLVEQFIATYTTMTAQTFQKPMTAKWEQTGGGCLTFWGQLDETAWYMTDLDDVVHVFDRNTDELFRVMNEGDSSLWEEKHEQVDRKFSDMRFMVAVCDLIAKNNPNDQFIGHIKKHYEMAAVAEA